MIERRITASLCFFVVLAALSKAAPIGEGSQADQGGTRPAEVGLAAKPQEAAYFRDGLIACGEQCLCSRDPEALQIGVESLAGNLLEESHELHLAHGAQTGRCSCMDLLAVILVDELKERAEALDILLPAFKRVVCPHMLVVALKQKQKVTRPSFCTAGSD